MEINLLPPDSADDVALTTGLAELVNEVYSVAEAGMWAEARSRSTGT